MSYCTEEDAQIFNEHLSSNEPYTCLFGCYILMRIEEVSILFIKHRWNISFLTTQHSVYTACN